MLVGCYGPSVAPGAPCDPAIGNCPSSQTCQLDGTEFHCLLPGTAIDAANDAELDAPDAAQTDLDGDGIFGTVDNCPAVANPSQHDEDTDTVGDVCDPCPISANNNDADGDGIGDDCDPRPAMVGDTLVVFEPFGQALPLGWTMTSGSWSIGNDELRVTSNTGAISNVRTNIPASSRMMAMTSVVPVQMFGSPSSAGVVLPHASMFGGGGIQCSLFQAAPGSRFLSLYDLLPEITINMRALAWVDGAPYTLVATKTDSTYACVDLGGVTVSGSSTTVVSNPTVGLRSLGATARFKWLLIVKMP